MDVLYCLNLVAEAALDWFPGAWATPEKKKEEV